MKEDSKLGKEGGGKGRDTLIQEIDQEVETALVDRLDRGRTAELLAIQGAIFDIDGTLLDSMPLWEKAGALYLESLGVRAEPGLGEKLYPMTMEDGARYLKDSYHLTYNIEEIIQGIDHTIQDYYLYKIPLKPGVGPFLEQLFQMQIPITAATSSDRCVVEAAFIRLEIMDYFQAIYTCSEVGVGKDRPDIYLAAQKAMGTPRGATWVFEDALHGACTAAKAGFPVIGVYDPSSESCQEEIKKAAQIYIEDFRQLKVTGGYIHR